MQNTPQLSLTDLAALLTQRRPLWSPRPFAHLTLDWEADFPELSTWSRGLPEARISPIDADEDLAPDAPDAWHALREESLSLTRVPVRSPSPPTHNMQHMRPRKQAQIAAFAQAVAPLARDCVRIVDWCAGKGHLSRHLAEELERPVVALEFNADLCDQGRVLAADLPCTFETLDVTAPDAAGHLSRDTLAAALHACGFLGEHLVKSAAHRKSQVALASCCYHYLAPGQEAHIALSKAGRALNLPLSRGDLRLSTAEEVAPRAPVLAARRREFAFRLGLDLLVREASGRDEYLPVGPVPRAAVQGPFRAFCETIAELRDLKLPARWDAERAEAAGHERRRVARGLALVRGLYRRPMECFLVADRAEHLREAGQTVSIIAFCARKTTPRNLLILATPEGA